MTRTQGPSFSTILMPPEKDEDLLGYIWRNSMTTGRRRMKGHVQAYVGRQALQPPWIVPSNLETLAQNLKSVFSCAEEILNNHTCLPAFLPFAAPQSLARIKGHVIHGKSHCGVPSMLGLAGRFVRSKAQLSLCVDCVKTDEETLGFSYWRRFHNLPGMTYCVEHGQPLVNGCGRCAYSGEKSRTPRLPGLLCWCGQPHAETFAQTTPEERAKLLMLADMAGQLLDGALSGRAPSEIGAYYAMRARMKGYRNGSRLRTPEIAREFQESYSPRLLRQLNASMVSVRSNWLVTSLGRCEAPLALTRNLLLFDFFGGRIPNEEDLKSAVAGDADERTAASAKKQNAPVTFDVKGARDAVESFLLVNPQAGRKELLQALGRTAVNLRALDREWYEQRIASKWGRDPLSSEKRETYSAEFDQRTAESIRKRRELLLSAIGRPHRITKRALLEGCIRANEVSAERQEQMPLTSKALLECLESSEAYKERYAIFVLKTAPLELDRHKEARRRTGLSMECIQKLVARHILKDVA